MQILGTPKKIVKSVQRISKSVNGTIVNQSIASVKPENTIIYPLGSNGNVSVDRNEMIDTLIKLTSATNLTFEVGTTPTVAIVCECLVVEYVKLKSKQVINKAITTSSDSTTIASVNLAKAVLSASNKYTGTTQGERRFSAVAYKLNNETTLNAIQYANVNKTINVEVAEML